MYRHNPLPRGRRRESQIGQVVFNLLVLAALFGVIVVVGGKAFDSGFESRCNVWGNPAVCETPSK